MTIITNIIGGLGNQMFQYAAGYVLAQKTGLDLKLDLNDYNLIGDKRFELEKTFGLQILKANKVDIKNIIGNDGNLYIRRFINKLGLSKNFLKEKPYTFNENFLNVKDSIYLDGYWQNYNYFLKDKLKIKQQFNFTCLSNKERELFFEKYRDRSCVSLHIRKGDYINKKNIKIFFPLDDKYYTEALNIIKGKIKNPYFFIFSDDLEWVNSNINLNNINYKIVPPSLIVGKDMALMSLCDHHIIANSTFSWWGAWLNFSKNKIVVTPKNWLNSNIQPAGLNCSSWIAI